MLAVVAVEALLATEGEGITLCVVPCEEVMDEGAILAAKVCCCVPLAGSVINT